MIYHDKMPPVSQVILQLHITHQCWNCINLIKNMTLKNTILDYEPILKIEILAPV